MKAIIRMAAVSLCASFANGSLATCYVAQGVVTLVPDASCQIRNALNAWQGSEAADALLANVPGADPVTSCFSASGTGTLQFTGFAGLTVVQVSGVDGASTLTPLTYAGPSHGARATLKAITAQGALTGRIGIGNNRRSGTLFTKDSAVVASDGKAAEIIKIVGGTGDFVNATGVIAVAGQELGGLAIYTGSVCTAN